MIGLVNADMISSLVENAEIKSDGDFHHTRIENHGFYHFH